ncbi:putative membrane protein [Acinetobacter sp. 479375]|nr:putative membrane protein [Acinetobacter sp. 479375]
MHTGSYDMPFPALLRYTIGILILCGGFMVFFRHFFQI